MKKLLLRTRRTSGASRSAAIWPGRMGSLVDPCAILSVALLAGAASAGRGGSEPNSTGSVLWPGGEVPYEFDSSVIPDNQDFVTDIMEELEGYAAVDFKERDGETFYLHIEEGSSGSGGSVSEWGYGGVGWGPTMTIGPDGWIKKGTLRHELLHVLGFPHEQQRDDRDAYVWIQEDNIAEDEELNFIYWPNPNLNLNGPYDFGSVMQYRACSKAADCDPVAECGPEAICKTCASCYTMEALDPHYDTWQLYMGAPNVLSPLDLYGLRAAYSESHFRFVDPTAIGPGWGSGFNPWKELSSALSGDSGSHVFILPGTYSAQGTWDTPMTLDACPPLEPLVDVAGTVAVEDGSPYDLDGDGKRDVVVWE